MQEAQIITSNSAAQTRELAAQIIADLRNLQNKPKTAQIICLSGDLGAGKTTFAQGLLENLGARSPYTSPTFTIIRQYELANHPNWETVYHIDPYRIDAPVLLDLGWQEICANPRALIILEWPSIVADIIPNNSLNITITSINENTREITISNNF